MHDISLLLIAVLLVCLQIATLVSATLVNESREIWSSETESMLFSCNTGFKRPRKFYPKLQNDLKSFNNFKSIDTKATIINPGSDFSFRCKSTEFKQVVIGKLSQFFALDASTNMCSAAKSKCMVNMNEYAHGKSWSSSNCNTPKCSKSSLKTAVNNAEVYGSKESALSDRKCYIFSSFSVHSFLFFFYTFYIREAAATILAKDTIPISFCFPFVKNMPCLIACRDCFLRKLTECCCYFQHFCHSPPRDILVLLLLLAVSHICFFFSISPSLPLCLSPRPSPAAANHFSQSLRREPPRRFAAKVDTDPSQARA